MKGEARIIQVTVAGMMMELIIVGLIIVGLIVCCFTNVTKSTKTTTWNRGSTTSSTPAHSAHFTPLEPYNPYLNDPLDYELDSNNHPEPIPNYQEATLHYTSEPKRQTHHTSNTRLRRRKERDYRYQGSNESSTKPGSETSSTMDDELLFASSITEKGSTLSSTT